MKNKRLLIILSVAAILLLIPLIAMQFTREVAWTFRDFAMMAVLLFGAGIVTEISLRNVKRLKPRIFILTAIFLLFLLVWIELAVGIIGSPLAGA